MLINKMRKTFVKILEELREKDANITLITADMGFGVLESFANRFPNEYFNVGIGEQNAVGMATGMAIEGKIPFVYTINSVLVFRAFEQIRMLAHMGQKEKLHCVLVGTGLGDEYTNQGISHYSDGDKKCLETIPINILTPKDKTDLTEKLNYIYSTPGVYYLRLTRFDKLPEKYHNE